MAWKVCMSCVFRWCLLTTQAMQVNQNILVFIYIFYRLTDASAPNKVFLHKTRWALTVSGTPCKQGRCWTFAHKFLWVAVGPGSGAWTCGRRVCTRVNSAWHQWPLKRTVLSDPIPALDNSIDPALLDHLCLLSDPRLTLTLLNQYLPDFAANLCQSTEYSLPVVLHIWLPVFNRLVSPSSCTCQCLGCWPTSATTTSSCYLQSRCSGEPSLIICAIFSWSHSHP